ncbi:MAG: transposase [Cyclobacteriaceae bacterium]|nr:MAG: transposase [Cyclobacteriaceae bacterium]
MNRLSIEKRTQIINLLVEGNSLRITSRITGTSINTVYKLLVDVGKACMEFHDSHVIEVPSKKIQCDEIWSFCYAKEKNVPSELKGTGRAGDVWTWTAIDSDTKLIVSWYVGSRDAYSANVFMKDVASRVANRVQLTTDGLNAYLEAVWDAFDGFVDYAQLVKIYGESDTEKRYSPAECIGTKKRTVVGNPDKKDVITSYVERQNLTMRMHMRRFTRLTNGFSKKIENHCYAFALHFVYYNWVKTHKTLRVTPAMEAGLTKNFMDIEDMVKLSD